jgi:hypothetical protein
VAGVGAIHFFALITWHSGGKAVKNNEFVGFGAKKCTSASEKKIHEYKLADTKIFIQQIAKSQQPDAE